MPRKILILDDEAEIRAELAEYLARKGYEVEEAGDGIEGLRKFEAAPADLVITDIKMPRLDGYEVIRRVRQIDPDLPIIAITGHFSPGDLSTAKDAGATVTMKKPLGLRELAAELKRLLEPERK